MQSIIYKRGELSVLDQLLLPEKTEYIRVRTTEDAWNVIRNMNVRGAPLIAIVAVLGLSVHLGTIRKDFNSVRELAAFLSDKIAYIRTSRPTAVNLFTATDDLSSLVKSFSEKAEKESIDSFCEAVTKFAEDILEQDIITNKAMGRHGANCIVSRADLNTIKSSVGRGLRVLTICNTGSLACAGYGTALGVVRALHERNRLDRVFACETRPYNQGARLTAFEIVMDRLPGTLITDSMAAALMATNSIDCVIVGADRVAANGDTANKIGTYQLAIAAKHHGVPFYVAAPTTSLDVALPNGSKIPVEQRPQEELTMMYGHRIAPEGIAAWNPAFDVTPCELITGIITELGVIEARRMSKVPSKGDESTIDARIIDVPAFLRSHGKTEHFASVSTPTLVPVSYKQMDSVEIVDLIERTPVLSSKLGFHAGDSITSELLHVTEVGDGNLNFVYIVQNPSTHCSIVIKQALPYVRCVGDSWPLSLERATFEQEALLAEKFMCPEHVPEVLFFEPELALIAMQYIPHPHVILRKALIRRSKIVSFAPHLATFMAKTLFKSSYLAIDGVELRQRVSRWSKNFSMCALTEQVIFTDPFIKAKYNHHTSPQLDQYVNALQSDASLKVAAADLKTKFMCSTEALLHGDLHTGSVMVMENSTYVIDPEFAFYGPIGFDAGSLMANLFLSYFSQPGHSRETDDDTDMFSEWILAQIETIHNNFTLEFTELWRVHHQENFGASVGATFDSPQVFLLDLAQRKKMRELWWDTLGFAGIEMIRRTVGIAHVEELKEIQNLDLKADCEKRVLYFARQLLLVSSSFWRESHVSILSDFFSIENVLSKARAIFKAPPPNSLLSEKTASSATE